MPVTPPFVSGCVTLASLCFTALLWEAGTMATPTWGEEEVGLTFKGVPLCEGATQVVVKNPPANARDARDAGLIPGSGRSPGGGEGCPFQYSCLETLMDTSLVGYIQCVRLQRVGHDRATEHRHSSVKEHRKVGGAQAILSHAPPTTASSMDLFPEQLRALGQGTQGEKVGSDGAACRCPLQVGPRVTGAGKTATRGRAPTGLSWDSMDREPLEGRDTFCLSLRTLVLLPRPGTRFEG